MGWRELCDSVLILFQAVVVYSGVSGGCLKACLAAVIDQCRGRFARAEGREDESKGGSKGEMMKKGALSVLVILIYSTLYTLKSFAVLPK